MPSRSFSADRVAAFRLARHHLVRGSKASLVDVCCDVAGVQAQVMSAAELSLWTRRRQTARADVRAALWTTRDLVKTTSMRRTLHLLPARDFQMYIAAMQAWSMSQTESLLTRIGASPKHVDTMIGVVLDALADGPKTQQDLPARAKVKAAKGMRIWLQYAWSAMRPSPHVVQAFRPADLGCTSGSCPRTTHSGARRTAMVTADASAPEQAPVRGHPLRFRFEHPWNMWNPEPQGDRTSYFGSRVSSSIALRILLVMRAM
jgi:hypothetical protein